jgi:hypothetical protein
LISMPSGSAGKRYNTLAFCMLFTIAPLPRRIRNYITRVVLISPNCN